MEGKGPYRIYDPGGSEVKSRDETVGSSSYRQLLEENSMLRERMKGLKSLGDLLEESQSEASRLRQRVEELVKDNEALKSSSFAASLYMGGPVQTETQSRFHTFGLNFTLYSEMQGQTSCLGQTLQPERSNVSSPDTIIAGRDKAGVTPQLPVENNELASELKRLESSFSIFAEESNPNQLLAHLGRMAVEFHHLSSKVQRNEQRTSLLQTLCEQLRQENNELRNKMEEDHDIRNRDLEQLRQENQKLKELVTGGVAVASTVYPSDTKTPETKDETVREEFPAVRPKMEAAMPQKSGKSVERNPAKPCDIEVYEKKIKLLEKQRKDVLEVNKQWDIQWNSMKSQFEQKVQSNIINKRGGGGGVAIYNTTQQSFTQTFILLSLPICQVPSLEMY
uniref:TNFAIP3 interacting protein 1 n=1 Tax=Nothobranchius furzeri TaxID=105023 RepID=A0A8C6M179_NOTFU